MKVIDARGSFCPGPLMELIRAVKESAVGDVIEIWSSDTGSQRDIPKWTEKAGHEFLGVIHEEGYDRIKVRKKR
ncbi:MAG: sulfurtransferase TusA family protein [Nitrososphaerota archaeon]|nr:sulfurtransferase TusA family protein [Nitrososphaerota archaeon]